MLAPVGSLMKNKPFSVGDTTIQVGERVTVGLPTPELYSYTSMHIPVHIIHGKKAGPCLLVCAAIHGDEVNGIAIIHRLLNIRMLGKLRGTLIAVPAINVYGLASLTRHLPGGRDLDGSFPGSESGSFAARLAHYFNQEILTKATFCIDIHSGSLNQNNLPHIHTNLHLPSAYELARAFQAPVVLHAETSRGLLWQNQTEDAALTLLYEAGEPLRLNEWCVRIGVRGILRVMRNLNMLGVQRTENRKERSVICDSTHWIRSPSSGLCRQFKRLGAYVKKGDIIAEVFDPFGTAHTCPIASPYTGIILTRNSLPLVNEGDFILQVAHTTEQVDLHPWRERIDL